MNYQGLIALYMTGVIYYSWALISIEVAIAIRNKAIVETRTSSQNTSVLMTGEASPNMINSTCNLKVQVPPCPQGGLRDPSTVYLMNFEAGSHKKLSHLCHPVVDSDD